jgi:hypothetical protein
MGIQAIKSELKNMRKSTEYIKARLKRIHCLAGFKFLKEAYSTSKPRASTDPRNFYIFSSAQEVINRYNQGKPLCGFVADDKDKVHVAFKTNNAGNIDFLTFQYDTKERKKTEAGVHFCMFRLLDGTTTKREDELNIEHHAIMLPYWHGADYAFQYTLIYSDWDVLRTDLDEMKGPACIQAQLFDDPPV